MFYKQLKNAFYDMYEFDKALKAMSKLGFSGELGMRKLHILPVEFYQDNFRVYLDEYEGQEKLRKDYVCEKISKRLNITKDYLKWVISKCQSRLSLLLKLITIDSQNNPETVFNLEYCWKDFDLLMESSEQTENDIYFERRWLRRN